MSKITLTKLNNTIWYRLIKVIWIFACCFSIFVALAYIFDYYYEAFDQKESYVLCESGDTLNYSELKNNNVSISKYGYQNRTENKTISKLCETETPNSTTKRVRRTKRTTYTEDLDINLDDLDLDLDLDLNLNKTNSFQYSNPLKSYSFLIPNNWTQLSEENIKQRNEEVKSLLIDYNDFSGYVTGFEVNNFEDTPYLSVQEHEIPGEYYKSYYKEIIDITEEKRLSNALPETTKETKNLIDQVKLGIDYFDEDRKIIFVNGKQGDRKGLTALFLGKESVVQLNFTCSESQHEIYLPVFKQVINSFKFENGYKYI